MKLWTKVRKEDVARGLDEVTMLVVSRQSRFRFAPDSKNPLLLLKDSLNFVVRSHSVERLLTTDKLPV